MLQLQLYINQKVIVVYTNCRRSDQRNFDHQSLKQILGNNQDMYLPCLHIQNAIDTILRANQGSRPNQMNSQPRNLSLLVSVAQKLRTYFFGIIEGQGQRRRPSVRRNAAPIIYDQNWAKNQVKSGISMQEFKPLIDKLMHERKINNATH